MYKKKFYSKSKYQKNREEKILKISMNDEKTLCINNTFPMFNESLKNLYKNLGGIWKPELKSWIISNEKEKELKKKAKEIYPNEKIKIISIPKFVLKSLSLPSLKEKKNLIFKSK